MHLYLLGMIGCGKTFWGRYAAELLDKPHIDLDNEIEKTLQCSIAQAITVNKMTWAEFRNLETDMLNQQTAKTQPAVISVGGGTPCFNNNMERIRITGLSVYLECPPEILFERLKAQILSRPILHDMDDVTLEKWIRVTLKEREYFYKQADITTNALMPDWEGIKNAFQPNT